MLNGYQIAAILFVAAASILIGLWLAMRWDLRRQADRLLDEIEAGKDELAKLSDGAVKALRHENILRKIRDQHHQKSKVKS